MTNETRTINVIKLKFLYLTYDRVISTRNINWDTHSPLCMRKAAVHWHVGLRSMKREKLVSRRLYQVLILLRQLLVSLQLAY